MNTFDVEPRGGDTSKIFRVPKVNKSHKDPPTEESFAMDREGLWTPQTDLFLGNRFSGNTGKCPFK